MGKIRITLLIFLIVLTCAAIAQQTPVLNHYYSNPYLINPAFVGQSGQTNASFIYRYQWAGIPGAPQTQVLTLDGPLDERPIGVGLIIINDKSNIVGRFTGMLSGSYKIQLAKEHQLSFGISAGIIRNDIKFDRIRAQDLSDSGLLANGENQTLLEGTAGLYYAFKALKVGFASEQLFNQGITYQNASDFKEISFALVRHYNITAHYDFTLHPDWGITPLALVRTAQGLPVQFDINAKVTYKNLAWTNIAYRHGSGVGFSLGARVNDRFSVGYNYELPTTALMQATSGSHEFMLGVRFIKTSGQPQSTRSVNRKMADEIRQDRSAQYEKLDEIQQSNEQLNDQLIKYKDVIEQQNSEIEKLKEVIDAFDEEMKATIGQLKVDLQEESTFDNAYNYYLIVGAFKQLPEAKSSQKILRREASLKTEIIQNDNRTWYFLYSHQLKSLQEAREEIRALENSNLKSLIIGNPWVYKTNKAQN